MISIGLPSELSLLAELFSVDSPSGDEHRMTEFLAKRIGQTIPSATIIEIGSSIVAFRGNRPHTAVMAHIDTTGFTLGYERTLIPIGAPSPENGDNLRALGNFDDQFEIRIESKGVWKLDGNSDPRPGSRFVYSRSPSLNGSEISSPYLDNRAGIWAAFKTLKTCQDVAVAFTTGEEVSGLGARACSKYMFEQLDIRNVLICDITWDTCHVHIGDGPAISLRDSYVPNRPFIDQIVELAANSGIPHQLEIESDGGSDGSHIDDGCYPMNWAFVGAPESKPHSSAETASTVDLINMAELYKYLISGIST